MADSKVGVCYVWLISSLLFIFTISGAVFLVLFIMQPTSPTTSLYPIIGVSLVCFPWVFWFVTILYRIISRACGFRMICFGSHGADQSDRNIPLGGHTSNDNGLTHNASLAPTPTTNISGGGNLVNENGNENGSENRASVVGSPRRVHFGGVVVLGEDSSGANENRGRSESLPSPSSSSSSSNNGDESETPLKLSMA